jgi:hypothetical protein
MVIEKSPINVPLLYDAWDVSCESQRSSVPWSEPAMMVNVGSCEVMRPVTASMDWDYIYGGLFEEGQKMPICP